MRQKGPTRENSDYAGDWYRKGAAKPAMNLYREASPMTV